MNWFLVALITPIAHAAVNHLDKYLISKYLKGGEVGSLVLFSALFAVVALPFVAWMDPAYQLVSVRDASILMVNGFLLVLAYICYFYALNKDEASFVAPLFQLVPVFGFVLGYFVLGETLTQSQLFGSLTVLVGAVVLSLQFGSRKVHIKREVIWLMCASSLLYAINGVLFKFVAETQQQFWPSLFWDFAGKVVFGLLLFFSITSYRRQFLAVLKENRASILGLNALNELLALLGEGALVFAALLAPVALVQIVSGFQPAFVFLFGILLTLFIPRVSSESLIKKDFVHKLAGIVIITLGTIILSR